MELMTMIEVNKIKDIEQRKALNAWASNNYIGSVIAGTGFGKSRIGVLAVNHALNYKNIEPEGRALILVPTVQLQDQFREEFHKWDLSHCLDNIDILCYQTAYKLKDRHFDIVICDEIHLGLSQEYRKFFDNNTYDKLLCMTATLPESFEYKEILKDLAPTIYTITLDECVELGLVSPYEIICIPVSLTLKERDDYKKINNNFVYWKYRLGQFDAFDQAKRILANKNADPADKQAAVQFYRTIRHRKAIIDFADNKVIEFNKLVMNNLDKKILAFGGANEFTDKLCASVSPYAMAYHSKKSKKQKDLALESFKNNDINVLCSTKALNQGFDIPDANMGIICGITSKSLSMIQRVGRLIRFQENKTGKIIILYIENSQEEKWLKQATKNLNNVIWK
tara:strand:- start:570 stop:1754 length:1185 start_codon:yes stop_codon:yes gene_type:complete